MSGDVTVWGPKCIQADGKVLVIGRAPAVDVRILHATIASQHAELRTVSGQSLLRDLGSNHGTKVNGIRISECVLKNGDRIEFGPVVYVYGAGCLTNAARDGIKLDARKLEIARGGRQLLRSVNLTIRPNQFVGVIGTSGSGKTTLLKCLAGFAPPASGRLAFDESPLPGGREDTDEVLAANRDVYQVQTGYVPQDDVVYPVLTVRENLEFSLRLRSVADQLTAAERTHWINLTLTRLHLEEHADKRVSVLSGGQRKRVNVAIELLSEPRILFLDEPTSGLDPAAEGRLMVLLKSLAGRGTTVVCSTHVLENVQLFDEVIVVASKTVVYQGPPGGLLAHFKVEDYAALYALLDGLQTSRPKPTEPTSAVKALAGIRLVPIAAPPLPATAAGGRILSQIAVQLHRGLLLVSRDKLLLSLLLGQPIAIGLMINLSQFRPNGLAPLFLFAVVTAIWLGLNNTAREVVRDRAVYTRERLAGLIPESYLAAKSLLFAGIGFVQMLLLTLVIRHVNWLSPGDQGDLRTNPAAFLILTLWVVYISAMLLGLLVSTLANSEETAVAALPLIILPQLLLTGAATGLSDRQESWFSSIVVLIVGPDTARGWAGWLLELSSMPLYSRPSLSLLGPIPFNVATSPFLVRLADWIHLLLLLLVTAICLLIGFRRCERRWLEQR